jgi:AcrR family transcriptional regulator
MATRHSGAPIGEWIKTETMANSPISPRPARRSQAERNAESRARLIEAAITCLHRSGYAGTTVSMVATEAGLSRGGMTHQFPTKVDLMLAVVRTEFDEDVAFYENTFTTQNLRRALADLPLTLWTRLNRPAAIAVTEIMLASRSDPDLAEKLRLMQAEIDRLARTAIAQRMIAADIKRRPDESAVHRVFVAAVRGLAIEALFMRDKAELEAAVAVLREMLIHIYPDMADDKE